MSDSAARWGDLRARVLSAAVMLAVGGTAIWAGGAAFWVLCIAVTGAMIWELGRMVAPSSALALGVVAATALTWYLRAPGFWPLLALLLPAIGLLLLAQRLRFHAALYALVIMAAGVGLVTLRDHAGIVAVIWPLAVVIASDVLGYFAGRMLGGPKFWPAISPKKTWSGTVAGWIGAALVGVVFVAMGHGGWGLVLLSPFLAFAGQMGDILESWFKRRTGIKDSSNLIPGHGGVLDRFDALIFAVVLAAALAGPVLISSAATGG
jgi:phosphatidate cytidylyltransferase